MDNKLVIKKIQALLYDPPEKPVILGRITHEGRAKELMDLIIEEAKIPGEVRDADRIASVADRIKLPQDEHFVADFRKRPVIIHPLSGEEFDLKSLMQIEMEDITSDVERAIVFLADKYKNNKERFYLALWRELIGRLADDSESKSKLGQLWELLPADTRIPDHSIWEHKRITAAIAGALPKPAFLLFSIGPVQDFIVTARKTHDLWAGSYLLSYLSWSAMKVVAEAFGPDSIIFPDLCRQPFVDIWLKNEKGLDIEIPDSENLSSPTLPNRFLAVIPEGSIKDIAEEAKRAVKSTFKEICDIVKEEMEERLSINFDKWNNIWQRQTEDFMETYWASVSVDDHKEFLDAYQSLMGTANDWEFGRLLKEYEKGFAPNIGTLYGQVYCLTEKILGTRKTIRNFSQQGEDNYKCTLCGVREPVHPGMYNSRDCSEDFRALRGFWQERVMAKFPQIRKSERLCAVCLSKRLVAAAFFKEKLGFEIDSVFPSVSMVATASFRKNVIKSFGNPEIKTRVKEFINHLQTLFSGKEDRMNGASLPMVHHMCNNEEAVNMDDRDLAKQFVKIEGNWFFEDSFKESLEEEMPNSSEDVRKAVGISLKNLLQAVKKQNIDLPSKYYAVIHMDGDDMGKWLSGENAPDINDILHPAVREGLDDSWDEFKGMKRPLNPSLHLSMSKALRDFSLHVVRRVVEHDHLGKLVYAGGDDVLAFVNLKDLPEVMQKLRAYFSGSLRVDTETGRVEIDFKEGSGFVPLDGNGHPVNVGSGEPVQGFLLSMGAKATASMGVVIAHHSANLSRVLDEVRASEKKAKKINNKNAFCIALVKRAGGTKHITVKWHYDLSPFEKGGKGGFFESISLLCKWADAFYDGCISRRFVYIFRTETDALEGMPAEAIKRELLRLANRQRDKKAKKFNEKNMEELVNGIVNFYAGGMRSGDIGKFLSVAEFFGREGNR